jgi:DNA-binding NarL/FixJ family response regulator
MKVLLADADPTFRAVVSSRMRMERPHEEVWEAEDGEQAVLLAIASRPQLVMMDMTLPGIGCLDAIRLIKSKLPEVQVLVLSTSPGDQETARQAGADAFFRKSDCWSLLNRLQDPSVEELIAESGEESVRPQKGDRCRSTGGGRPVKSATEP